MKVDLVLHEDSWIWLMEVKSALFNRVALLVGFNLA